MEELQIYKGRGTADMRDDYLDFINYVFGFNGNDEDFLKLLPKLYKEEYHPCENNYVVTENGKLKAAIGVFPRTMHVLDETLSVHGVGNVAVHPYSRSKGYMRDLLYQAVQDMIDAGADMADLGGRRQRYQYFSYEVAGTVINFDFNSISMERCFGDAPMKNMDFVAVKSENDPWLAPIRELHSRKGLRMERPAEQFFDIVRSWQKTLYVILEGERFVGYCIDNLEELTLADTEADFVDVLRSHVAKRGNVTLHLPLYETAMIETSYRISAHFSMGSDQNYSIFNYKKVLGAFLKLKASVLPLMDGVLTVQIDGIAGREVLKIAVENGVPSVEETEDVPQIVLEHKQAVSFFFGLVSPVRTLCPIAAAWFPLPLRIDSADHV
ncbi:MAG: GNAT family N-acetyltransferase [Clostridia bacterium]|nr:GNAT family N-acetyltransferase [Clostridia bacterium]